MWREVIVACALCGVAACGSSAEPTTEPSVTADTTASTSTTTEPAGSDETVTTEAAPVTQSEVAPLPASGTGASVEVSGGELPSAVVGAYGDGGGDMVAPAEWLARYGDTGLPSLAGSGVVIVEAKIDVEATVDGLRRIDETQWLFMDNRDDIAAILDELAASVNAGVPVVDRHVEDEGAQCVQREYVDGSGLQWSIQGCAYPEFRGMFAAGVSRKGTFAGDVPVLDGSQPGVAALDMMDVLSASVELKAPNGAGSTMYTRVTIKHGFEDLEELTDELVAGPLAGWQVSHGFGTVLGGPTGGSWTVGDTLVVFERGGQFS